METQLFVLDSVHRYAHLIVLLQEGVNVLEEGDGGCAVDHKLDLIRDALLILG